MTEWVGDRLRPFDRARVYRSVQRVVGTVPATMRLLLDLVGAGVRLTPGGSKGRGSPDGMRGRLALVRRLLHPLTYLT